MATGDWVKGLLIGGVAGAIIGVLLAPKSGKENREDLRKMLGDLVEKAEHSYEESLAELHKLVNEGSTAYEDKKGRLKRAFDAAIAAYKAEKEGAGAASEKQTSANPE